jgi:hypothetical protein
MVVLSAVWSLSCSTSWTTCRGQGGRRTWSLFSLPVGTHGAVRWRSSNLLVCLIAAQWFPHSMPCSDDDVQVVLEGCLSGRSSACACWQHAGLPQPMARDNKQWLYRSSTRETTKAVSVG